ncbi:MAG: GWxTD domain-containing protein [bacterium]|nr:GWxTD domain-containing protein [bacterium]
MKSIAVSLVLIVLLAAGIFPVGKKKKITHDPAEKVVIEATKFIMTRKEKKEYKHLPDKESKRKYIADFWKKRDPNPDTEDNEVREEFERRLDYIHRWFSEKPGRNRGMESDRGKVFLLLGEPDERETGQGFVLDRFKRRMKVSVETWRYNRFRIQLRFEDKGGLGEFLLHRWSNGLMIAMEQSKFEVFNKNLQGASVGDFKFKALFKNNEIKINIPGKNVAFVEKDGKMTVGFEIHVEVFKKKEKVDSIELTRDISETKENLLKSKFIVLTVPYTPKKKGKHRYDIVVREMNSDYKYRFQAH